MNVSLFRPSSSASTASNTSASITPAPIAQDSAARQAFLALGVELADIARGQKEVIEKLLCCFLSSTHALLEDLPGSGKTTLAKALCAGIGGVFRRAQFTPDLMPSDLLGSSLFNPQTRSFELHQGPVFCNLLLADEINRASPRAQSALLEAMAEGQVSIEGESLLLPNPFFVIATQNPMGTHGAFPLPEAQLDRFGMRLSLTRLTPEQEADLIFSKSSTRKDAQVSEMGLETALLARQEVEAVLLSKEIAQYIASLARATRTLAHEERSGPMHAGVSSRAAIALARSAQALAWLRGRNYVVPADCAALVFDVWAHRLGWAEQGEKGREKERALLARALSQEPIPH